MTKAANKVEHVETPEHEEDHAVTGTSIAERALSLVGSSFQTAAGKFKIKKQVTHSVLRQKDNETIFVKIIGEIYTGEELKNTRAGQPKMEPARLAKVIDLSRPGAIEAVIIVNKVLEGELIRAFDNVNGDGELVGPDKDGNYPKDTAFGYVGKTMAIKMLAAQEGTRYKRFEVYEIEMEE